MRNATVMLKRRRREEGRNREATTDEELWSPGLTLTPVCGGGFPQVKTAPQLRLE